MELTFSQIKNLTVGALTVTETPEGIAFSRTTPTQRAAYKTVFEAWAQRSDSTTGIRIDFHTDASAFTATVAATGKYEVLVDDLTAYFEVLTENSKIYIPLDGLDHRITLVLPCHTPGMIKSIELENPSYITPHKYSRKVAFYGDSITQGATSEKDSQCYTWLLTRYFDFESYNFGVGGIRFQPETVEDVGIDPELVFIALGTNNYGSNRPLELLQENCPAFFDSIKALYPKAKIFCITPIWRADGEIVKNVGTIHDARALIETEARNRGMIIIDGFTLVPHRTEYYADERLHPNDLGFAQYSMNLLKAISPHL